MSILSEHSGAAEGATLPCPSWCGRPDRPDRGDLMIVLSGFLRNRRGPLFPRESDGLHHTPDRVS